jgi:hypothetical protein
MARYASFKRRGKSDTAPNEKTRLHNSRSGRAEKHFLPEHFRKPNYHLHPLKRGQIKEQVLKEKRENEERYFKKNNRKLRSDAVRVESALLILSEEQVAKCDPDKIWEKALEFKEWFEKEFETKIRAMDWHRDEGGVENGKLISRNEHIHIEYDNVDMHGEMVRRKFSKGTLHKFQDKVAEIFKPLGFVRGEDSRKNPEYKVKRGLSIKEYRKKIEKEKAIKKQENLKRQQSLNSKLIKKSKSLKKENDELKKELGQSEAKIKDINELNKLLRAELKAELDKSELSNKQKRARFAELEHMIIDLKNQVRDKKISKKDVLEFKIEGISVSERIQGMRSLIESQAEEIQALKSSLPIIEYSAEKLYYFLLDNDENVELLGYDKEKNEFLVDGEVVDISSFVRKNYPADAEYVLTNIEKRPKKGSKTRRNTQP